MKLGAAPGKARTNLVTSVERVSCEKCYGSDTKSNPFLLAWGAKRCTRVCRS